MALTRVTKTGNITVDGDIGIGVVPGEWSVNYPAFQIGQGGTFTGHRNNTQTQLGQNWWVGTGNQYVVNGAASRMIMNPDSTIIFSQAPSGTAGATMSTTHNRLVINPSGYVTTPNVPSFMAHGNASWQISTAGSNITFGGVAFNNSGSYNSSNSRFTAPVAGKYMFITTLYQDNSYDCRFCMAINGVQLNSFGDVIPYGYTRGVATSGESTLSIQYIANLNLNDYVEVRQRASYGSARVYTSHSHFGGYLIG
jgi:hypothetical protein